MTEPYALTYRVEPAAPEAHLFAVELLVAAPPAGECRLSMPAWIPGSYMIRDFARNLTAIEAEDALGTLPVAKLDKQTWAVRHRGGSLRVRWQVYAWELTRALGPSRHPPTPTSTAPRCSCGSRGLRVCPAEWSSRRPRGRLRRLARRHQPRAPRGGVLMGFGTYRADDYEDLIDHPVEMGRFTLVPVRGPGRPPRHGHHRPPRADEQRLLRDLLRICEQHVALFGELPIDRYLFLTTAVGEGYGGLEHRFSTSLICTRDDLPRAGEDDVSRGLSALSRARAATSTSTSGTSSASAPRRWWTATLDAGGSHPAAVGLRGHHLLLRRAGPGALRAASTRAPISSCWPRPSPA